MPGDDEEVSGDEEAAPVVDDDSDGDACDGGREHGSLSQTTMELPGLGNWVCVGSPGSICFYSCDSRTGRSQISQHAVA